MSSDRVQPSDTPSKTSSSMVEPPAERYAKFANMSAVHPVQTEAAIQTEAENAEDEEQQFHSAPSSPMLPARPDNDEPLHGFHRANSTLDTLLSLRKHQKDSNAAARLAALEAEVEKYRFRAEGARDLGWRIRDMMERRGRAEREGEEKKENDS
ncbi:Hypothetical predicted protein [Lecanosticta acicola]|uniref:Uncharacterized protein n=1 Tax=Lecanosticta acicola TaxID=111012 RepID=A0AAI8Z697_9PEZI|nr:Hypothetical predicted protein [Lecanosticta acicola]